MGVWIETQNLLRAETMSRVTPCMGVWIETVAALRQAYAAQVTPCMGVWIETQLEQVNFVSGKSHPVWVCGLKLISCLNTSRRSTSHPVWVCGLKRYTLPSCRGRETSHPVWVCGLKHPAGKKEISIRSHTLYGCVD